VVVERPGLVQDRFGDRDLADVVQLRRLAHGLDVLELEAEAPRSGLREQRDVARVAVEIRVALGERPQQHVGGLAADRAATAALARVHPLVGEPQGVGGVGRLLAEDHRAPGARDREALAMLGERARRLLDQPRDRLQAWATASGPMWWPRSEP